MAKSKKGGWGMSVSLTGPGTVFTIAIITLAIGFGMLFTRGVTPHNMLSDPGKTGEIEVIPETPAPDEKGLQLRTIRFRECGATTAVTMQLDITGSMSSAIRDLQRAVLSFTDPLSDDSIIGIQAYSTEYPRLVVVPVSYYRDVKSLIRPRVLSLGARGRTTTYDALIFSGEILAVELPKYPDRKFNFIFFSDGNPNEGPSGVEDIRQAAQTIKDQGVTSYAIGLSGDEGLNPDIIKAVASDDSKAIMVTRSTDLESVYKQIAQKICNSQITPTP